MSIPIKDIVEYEEEMEGTKSEHKLNYLDKVIKCKKKKQAEKYLSKTVLSTHEDDIREKVPNVHPERTKKWLTREYKFLEV
jgi:hypothetical protein